jgi:hypothetical protein
MAFEQDVADRLEPILSGRAGMVETRMMGGFGYLCYGNMCAGIHKNFLIVRLGLEQFEVLSEQFDELRTMDITGKPMKGWGMIDSYACDNETFKILVESSEEFARTLPKKPEKN